MKRSLSFMVMLLSALGIMAQDLAITMKTDRAAGETVELKVAAGGSGTSFIDWGDGTLEEYPDLSASVNNPTTITKVLPVDNAEIKMYVQGQYFTFLTCANNSLTELDVSNTSTLRYLRCNHNKLTALDITTHEGLLILECQSNSSLGELDLTNSISMTRLWCWASGLTKLVGIENAGALKEISARENPIAEGYDVAGMTSLEQLYIQNNSITELNVEGCNNLYAINLSNGGPAHANNLDACALNDFYHSLPDRTGLTTKGSITIIYGGGQDWENNDVLGSNTTIATAKNWEIKDRSGNLFTGDGGGCVVEAYGWLRAPAIVIEGGVAKVYGPNADVFTKIYVNGVESNDVSSVTGKVELRATNADASKELRLTTTL